jgi:hypothetical protein
MGYQHNAESESQSPTQFAEHPGIKSTTEQALIKRNNTNEMLPENNTGKDDETAKRTHNVPIANQGEEPDGHERTPTETPECIGTDKLDPTIGSIRKTQQGRNLAVDTKPMLMNSSTPKLNRDA